MNTNQNWYRQLLALVLTSASRAAVEFITNPDSRVEAQDQLRESFKSIDYDALATALSRMIENTADTSKASISEAIDTMRDRSLDAVDEAKVRAEKQLGNKQKKGGRRVRFVFGLVMGAVIAYFVLDEQRRDELLDRLTGASGPIEQSVQSYAQPVTQTAQNAVSDARASTENASNPAPSPITGAEA
jgi:hypothetical protein